MAEKTKMKIDDYNATGIAEGWIVPEDADQIVEAWQHLADTGLAWKLQGWCGRTATNLIKQGVINGCLL